LATASFPKREAELRPHTQNSVQVQAAYRIDLLVEESVVVEIKSVATIIPIHEAQLLSQLKLGDFRVGLLMNFNVLHLRDGIVRRVHRL
jgi:GxxExxY protein